MFRVSSVGRTGCDKLSARSFYLSDWETIFDFRSFTSIVYSDRIVAITPPVLHAKGRKFYSRDGTEPGRSRIKMECIFPWENVGVF